VPWAPGSLHFSDTSGFPAGHAARSTDTQKTPCWCSVAQLARLHVPPAVKQLPHTMPFFMRRLSFCRYRGTNGESSVCPPSNGCFLRTDESLLLAGDKLLLPFKTSEPALTLGSTGARLTAFMPLLAGVVPGSSLTLGPLAACTKSLFLAHCRWVHKKQPCSGPQNHRSVLQDPEHTHGLDTGLSAALRGRPHPWAGSTSNCLRPLWRKPLLLQLLLLGTSHPKSVGT
jgi:hypothetical protein